MSSKYFAVAGINGYAHFSMARRKWKLFGNETRVRTLLVQSFFFDSWQLEGDASN